MISIGVAQRGRSAAPVSGTSPLCWKAEPTAATRRTGDVGGEEILASRKASEELRRLVR